MCNIFYSCGDSDDQSQCMFLQTGFFFVTFSEARAISNAHAMTIWRLKWIWLSAGSIMFCSGQSALWSYSSWLPTALDQGLPGGICFHLRKIHNISLCMAFFSFFFFLLHSLQRKKRYASGCLQWTSLLRLRRFPFISFFFTLIAIILEKEGINYSNDSHLKLHRGILFRITAS